MKSISPSAVILGPMTGIMLEAAVMELILRLTGRNLAGYMLAGSSALLSTILHKLINLFIRYGEDLVTIYANLFEFLRKQLDLPGVTTTGLILTILAVYTLVGALAGFAGALLGKRALSRTAGPYESLRIEDPYQTAWLSPDPGQAFRIALLPLHFLMVPAMLFLINRFGLDPRALIPAGSYFLFLVLYYPRIGRRLLKPFFWSQLLLMTTVAVLFWRPGEGLAGRMEGFTVGMEMSLRAVLVVSTFSAISVEIRNPLITRRILGSGMSQAYGAISLAFNSLPVMLDRSSRFRSFLRQPLSMFFQVISDARAWHECYQAHLKS
jgi:hypothetical protein